MREDANCVNGSTGRADEIRHRLFLHCWPCELVCFSMMGLWIDRWPHERELIPNIKAENLNEAFKSCLGTEAFWCRDGYGKWKCTVCGIEMPGFCEAEDHPFTAEIFSKGAIEAAQTRKAREVSQEVQSGDSLYVVFEADA